MAPARGLIYVDTHVAAWLYAGRLDLFPHPTAELLEAHDLLASPIVTLELQYLHEVGRTAEPAAAVVAALAEQLGLAICDLPFQQVVRAARDQRWTRDPYDRLIVGQAAARGAPLLTRDRTILEHFPGALWEG